MVQPPPVQGIGNAGGFRMMIEDRAGSGPQALQAAAYAMMGKRSADAGARAGVLAVRDSTPQLYLDIDRTKAQLLGINMPDVFNALQTYIGSSYVNDFNLFGRTFRVQAQAAAPFRLDPQDVLNLRVRNTTGNTVPLGSFTTVRDISGPYRVPRYNIYPAAELDGAGGARLFAGPGDRDHGKARRGDAARRLRLRVDDAGVPAESRRQHGSVRLRARRRVRVPGAGGAVREPDLAARGDSDRADVSRLGDHRRAAARPGQQHSDPGRLHRADRARRQERDPDRRVRARSSRITAAIGLRRRSKRRGCASGRS